VARADIELKVRSAPLKPLRGWCWTGAGGGLGRSSDFRYVDMGKNLAGFAAGAHRKPIADG